MKLTLEQLKEMKPCAEGFKWYSQNIKTEEVSEILTRLAEHRWGWCRWLFVRLLDEKQNRLLAIYCAELALPIFEEKYPDDKRPRECLQAAKDYFLGGKITKGDLAGKRRAAADADADAYDAAYAAYAAADADAAAYDAAYAAAAAYADANIMKTNIVNKALELLGATK